MLAKFSSILGLKMPHLWTILLIPTYTLSSPWLIKWKKIFFLPWSNRVSHVCTTRNLT
jgi:hypothetical protein